MMIYKLSDIMQIVSKGFHQLFSSFNFWFETEISKSKLINNILYLDLLELSSNGSIIAKSKGIIFQSTVWQHFLQTTGIANFDELKNNKILAYGNLNFHPDYGFSIIISNISTEFTLGQFQQNIQHIRQTLISLKIYQNNQKLTLPFPPFKLVVISSANSEGFKDFDTIISNSQYNFQIRLFTAAIHGNTAKQEVHSKLQEIFQLIKKGEEIDLILIIRGGGGSQGITWQNDLNIAKGISYMPKPVIIAIGHTSDKSILDEIAYDAAKTPSDAAYKLINIIDEFLLNLKNEFDTINNILNKQLDKIKNEINLIYQDIGYNSQNKILQIKKNIQDYYEQIMLFSPEKLTQSGYALMLDLEDKLLNKDKINNLNIDDELYLKIYQNKFKVKIIK